MQKLEHNFWKNDERVRFGNGFDIVQGRAGVQRLQLGRTTPGDGDSDQEIPHAHQRMHLQRIISGHVDGGLCATLLLNHEEEGSQDSLVRLPELSSADVDLWKLNPHLGLKIPADEFVGAVRFVLVLQGHCAYGVCRLQR